MNMIRKIGLTVAMAAVTTASAQAQVVEKRVLSLDGAKRVIAAAVAEARRLNAPGGVIAVVDDGGNLMALERMDGTFSAGANISIGKARTAVLFKRPTRAFEEIIKNGRTAMVALPDAYFTPLQGGIPITLDSQVIGGIGVSGAASAQQDEELALAGAAAVNIQAGAGSPGSTPAVNYFTREQVAEAFAKGTVLLDGQGRNFMVHASRRNEPGVAEVHVVDTDIIYVLSGTATLVTGGSVVDARTTAPDEVRGSAIRGGDSRRIREGDVITVPQGTPHWFQEFRGPLTYYVVKVRPSERG
ncbi:MAG: heme-binding protein [Acidobacteria bacterium]|nr:heme-binding protein [Acidobacteriota bacterium]